MNNMTYRTSQRILLTTSLAWITTVLYSCTALGQERDFHAYPENVAKYLKRIYDQKQQPLAFREDYIGGFAKWQQDSRAALRQRIGLPRTAASVGHHQPVVELDDPWLTKLIGPKSGTKMSPHRMKENTRSCSNHCL